MNQVNSHRCCHKETHSEASFSRARHFALILIPMVIAVAYVLARDSQGSLSSIVPAFLLLLLSLGVAVGILRGIDMLDKLE